MSYWTADEIKTYIESDTFTLSASDEAILDDVRSAVINEFEVRTGWQGYFVAAAGTFYYTLEGRISKLVLDIPAITVSSFTIDGTAQTVNSDYWLEPLNATRKLLIELGYPAGSAVRGAVVVGTFGYSASCPADVNIAIAEAVLAVYRDRKGLQQSMNAGGEVEEVKSLRTSVKFVKPSAAELSKVLDRTPSFAAAVGRYTFRRPY